MPQNFHVAQSLIRTLLACATLAIRPAHASLCGESFLNLLPPRRDAASFTATLTLEVPEVVYPFWAVPNDARITRIVSSTNPAAQSIIERLHSKGITDLFLVDSEPFLARAGNSERGPYLAIAVADDIDALAHEADHALRFIQKIDQLKIRFGDDVERQWTEFNEWFRTPSTDVMLESRAVEAQLRMRKNEMVADANFIRLNTPNSFRLRVSEFVNNRQLENLVTHPQRAALGAIWKHDPRLEQFSNELRLVKGEDTTRLIAQYLRAYPDLFQTLFDLTDESFRKLLSIRLAEVNRVKASELTDTSIEELYTTIANLKNLDQTLFNPKPLGSPEFVDWLIETRFPGAWNKLKNRFPAHFRFDLPPSPR